MPSSRSAMVSCLLNLLSHKINEHTVSEHTIAVKSAQHVKKIIVTIRKLRYGNRRALPCQYKGGSDLGLPNLLS